MTAEHHPTTSSSLDEADVRGELARTFDACQGCRACLDRCGVFPTMFEFIDRHDDRDAGRLTPAQQDRVVDECFHCGLCVVGCPFGPGRHETALDLPKLMVRAKAMRVALGQIGGRERVTNAVMARPDRIGAVGSLAAPVANRLVGAPPGSRSRRVLEAAAGVSSVRLLVPFARQRFTTWFTRRPKVRMNRRQARVAVFPSCVVEYHQPAIGQDLVKVFERNGVECSLAAGVTCCGAPALHSGQLDRFTSQARTNVAALAAAVRQGKDIVVPQPTCSAILKREYPDVVGGPDAQLVAQHTFDGVEFLMRLHRGEGTSLDTDFTGEVPATITYHLPCHLQGQGSGLKSRDLLRLTGARVRLVQQCAGNGSGWGLRARHADEALTMATRLGSEVRRASGEVVAGDCHLANTAIAEQTGASPLHPLQVIARAYGIPPEPAR